MLLFILIYTAFITTAVLRSNCWKIRLGHLLLLLVIPSVLPNAISATDKTNRYNPARRTNIWNFDYLLENGMAVLYHAVVVFWILHIAFSGAILLLPEELAVLPPEVLVVPVHSRFLLVVTNGIIGREIYSGCGLSFLVADGRIPLAHALRVAQIRRTLPEHAQVHPLELLIVLSGKLNGHGSVLERLHHALGQFVLAVGQFRVFAFVFSLVGEQLARAVQDVVAIGPDTVDVVAHFGKSAVFVGAGFVFHEFLKAVAR